MQPVVCHSHGTGRARQCDGAGSERYAGQPPVQLVLQRLIEVDAAAVIRGRYERTESRVTERNGSRPRVGP
jgi:hypothetical protein